jgi:hypothetical protein
MEAMVHYRVHKSQSLDPILSHLNAFIICAKYRQMQKSRVQLVLLLIFEILTVVKDFDVDILGCNAMLTCR